MILYLYTSFCVFFPIKTRCEKRGIEVLTGARVSYAQAVNGDAVKKVRLNSDAKLSGSIKQEPRGSPLPSSSVRPPQLTYEELARQREELTERLQFSDRIIGNIRNAIGSIYGMRTQTVDGFRTALPLAIPFDT